MNKKYLVVALLVITSFSILRITQVKDRIEHSSAEVVEQILSNKLYSNIAAPLVERSIDILSVSYPIFKNIVVNEEPLDGDVSIVIVDSKNINYSIEQENLVNKSNNNMLSIDNKYIVVDLYFISSLLLNSSVDFGFEVQIEERKSSNDESFDDRAIRRTVNAGRMLRVSNIYSNREANNPEEGLRLISTYNNIRGINSISSYINKMRELGLKWGSIDYPILPIIVYDLSGKEKNEEFPFSDVYAVPFSSSFLPLLAHEFGHIAQGHEGQFLGRLSEVADKALADMLKYEESEADKFAVGVISKGSVLEGGFYDLSGYKYDYRRGVYSSAKMLEDISFYKHFHRFRDMNTQSIGSLIVYNEEDCSSSTRGFFDMNKIEDIKETLMPILTTEEYEGIIQREASNNSSHPHLYGRSVMFQSLAKKYPARAYDNDTTYASHVRRVLTNGNDNLNVNILTKAYKKDLDRLYSGKMTNGVASAKDILEFLSDVGYEISSAAACPFDKCFVLSWDGTYIEIGIRSENIVYATYYIRSFSKFNIKWDQAWSDSTEESLMRHAVNTSVFALLINILSEKRLIQDSSELSEFFSRFYTCGFSSFSGNFDTGTIAISTYDNNKSMFLRFVSN